jgi:hypothetical protein
MKNARKRKVAFLIPASASQLFLSQVIALDAALKRLDWQHWEPMMLVCLGGDIEVEALQQCRSRLRDAAFVLAPVSHSDAQAWFYAQIDGLFRWIYHEADAFVRMDADMFPVGGFEDVLDHVVETNSIAGVMAHFPFPTSPERTSRQEWVGVADGLIDTPLDFRQAYSLVGAEAAEGNRIAPFYVNDGAVFIPKALFADFAELFLRLRPLVMERLVQPYYAGQVALSLAVTEMKARTSALPMRYNFPNDELAAARFPEELENVKIFHYLRTHQFDRKAIFSQPDKYREFLNTPAVGVNKVFQEHVRRVFGDELPFS